MQVSVWEPCNRRYAASVHHQEPDGLCRVYGAPSSEADQAIVALPSTNARSP